MIVTSIYLVYSKHISDICPVNDFSLSFGRLSCTDPGPRRPPATARADPPATPPDPSLRLSVVDMSRLKKKLCRSAATYRAGPSAGPPPLDGVPRRHRASTDGPVYGPGCCAPNTAPGTAWPAARRRTGPPSRSERGTSSW
jgi:hypothetical protein